MNKDIKNIQRQQNYDLARQEMLKYINKPLTHEIIKAIHALVEPNERHGYRTEFGNVPIKNNGKEIFNSSTGMECTKEMHELLNNFPGSLWSVEQIIKFHWKFVKIHPFIDGNGRTVRLLMSLMLLNCGYTNEQCLKINVYLEADQHGYYDALNDGKDFYDKNNEPSEKFLNYMHEIINKAR